MLVKLTSLPTVRQSDGRRPRGPTESITHEYRVSCRTTIDYMWPKHVCMKGLCNVLNNKFTTLMFTCLTKRPTHMVAASHPPPPRRTHPHTHTANPPQLRCMLNYPAVNICYQRRDVLISKKTEIFKTFWYIDWFSMGIMCKNQTWATCTRDSAPKWIAKTHVSHWLHVYSPCKKFRTFRILIFKF